MFNKMCHIRVGKCFVFKVHLLNEERRGPTLEAIVSRMKAVQDALKQKNDGRSCVRFVAVSATIPNINDVADWLGTPLNPAKSFMLVQCLLDFFLNYYQCAHVIFTLILIYICSFFPNDFLCLRVVCYVCVTFLK